MRRARPPWNNINIAAKGAAQILRALWKAINHCPKGSHRVQDRYSRRRDCGSSVRRRRSAIHIAKYIPSINIYCIVTREIDGRKRRNVKRSLVQSINGHCLFLAIAPRSWVRFRDDYGKRFEYRRFRDKAINRCVKLRGEASCYFRFRVYVGYERNVSAPFFRMMKFSLKLNTWAR